MRQAGIEPGRNGHHVRLSGNRIHPRLVTLVSFVLGPDGPGIPAEEAVNVIQNRLDPGRAQARPRGHGKASRGAFDPRPVSSVPGALKRGDQRPSVIEKLGGAILKLVDGGDDPVRRPRTARGVVERQEEEKVARSVGRIVSVFEHRVGI